MASEELTQMRDSAMVGQRPRLCASGVRSMNVANSDLHWFFVSICAFSCFQLL